GGLLVFDLPGLQVKNGRRLRVFHNQVFANNHANFAPQGKLPAELGVYVKNNGTATFANLHWDALSEKDYFGNLAKIERRARAYEGGLPRLPGVTLPGVP